MNIKFTVGSRPERFARPALMWVLVDGKSYDFSGFPFDDENEPLTGSELNIVHEAAARLGIDESRKFYIKDDVRLNAPPGY